MCTFERKRKKNVLSKCLQTSCRNMDHNGANDLKQVFAGFWIKLLIVLHTHKCDLEFTCFILSKKNLIDGKRKRTLVYEIDALQMYIPVDNL